MEEEQEEKGADRLLFSFLSLLTKLSKHCGFLELSKPHSTLCNIWGKGQTDTSSLLNVFHASLFFSPARAPAAHIEAHLRYPHYWVWLTASQLLGQLFAAHQPEQLVAVWRGEGGETSTQSSATTFITNRLDKKVRQKTTCMI